MATTSNLTALEISLTFPRSSWFGLGFGPHMIEAELVMMIAPDEESETRIISTRTPKKTKPPIPASNSTSYPLSWENLNETHVRFNTTRKFVTGVEGEDDLAVGKVINMLYAFKLGNLTNDTLVRKHQQIGYWGIYIKDSGAVVLTENLGVDFYRVHGFLMWGAWGILGLVQLVSNRYLKGGSGWRYAMWAHRISGTLTLLITLTMAFLALKEADWEVEVGLH